MDTSQITRKTLNSEISEVADRLQKQTRITDQSQKINLMALYELVASWTCGPA